MSLISSYRHFPAVLLVHVLFSLSFTPRFARFGSALSKCRTLHWSDNMKKAKKFLKLAQRTGNSFNKTKKVNNMWIKAAKLESVMNYLAQRWQLFAGKLNSVLLLLACWHFVASEDSFNSVS